MSVHELPSVACRKQVTSCARPGSTDATKCIGWLGYRWMSHTGPLDCNRLKTEIKRVGFGRLCLGPLGHVELMVLPCAQVKLRRHRCIDGTKKSTPGASTLLVPRY